MQKKMCRKKYVVVEKYVEKTNRKVMFEYVLIKGVNDSDEDAKELAEIMSKKLYFVNCLICSTLKPSLPPIAGIGLFTLKLLCTA